jgi:hypothetical protein
MLHKEIMTMTCSTNNTNTSQTHQVIFIITKQMKWINIDTFYLKTTENMIQRPIGLYKFSHSKQ